MIKTSAIIPTYNRKRDLKDCLDSLLYQDAPLSDFEIIVIDDGSNDNTEGLFVSPDRWKALQLVYIKQEKRGASRARNKGVEIAKGKILAFIDSDCIAAKDWIRNIIYYHERFPDIAAIQGRILSVFNNSYMAITEQKALDRYFDHLITDGEQHKFITTVFTCNCSIKIEVFRKLNCSFSEEFFVCEDIDFANQILDKKGKIMFFDDIIVRHKHRTNLFSYMKRYFILGQGQYLMQLKWQKGLQDYQTKKIKHFDFTKRLFYETFIEYPLKEIIFFILYLMIRLILLSGYIYEKIRRKHYKNISS